MRILLIFNSKAAHGRAGKLLPVILDQFEAAAVEVVVEITQHRGHAIDIVAEANLQGIDGIVAAGGDGTLFEVVNGLFRNSSEHPPPLGILPIGTGNSFARDFDLNTGDWLKAVAMIARNSPKPVDVAKFVTSGKTHYFLNVMGLGFVTEVMKTSMGLKAMGNMAYILAVFYQMLFLDSYQFKLKIDGESSEREVALLEISNTRYTAHSFYMAPAARFDDGLLDITLVGKISRWRLLRLFPSIFTGQHVNAPEVETFRVRELEIETSKPIRLGPDGELFGETPLKVECLKHAIRVFHS